MTHWAKITFWFAALSVLYSYAVYPALLYWIALFRRYANPDPGYTPFLSVLIAACNEEDSIAEKLRQTVQLEYPPDKLEILIVSDASEDRTDEIVRNFSDPRVRLVRIPERRGKTNAQNVGTTDAKGEVLVFSDATTIYHRKALLYLAANYSDPRVGAVSGRYEYFDSGENSPTALGSIAFWNYENRIKQLQSTISTLTGCCGCIYSVRKDAYTELSPAIISDLVQPLCVIQKGYRVVFEPRAIAYEQTTESSREEFAMRVRVITRGMRGLVSVRELLKPWRHPWIAFQLFSHKVLRWMVPLFLSLILVSSATLADRRYFGTLLLLQVFFYGFALLQSLVPIHRHWKPLGIPLYFCTLNAAALLAMIELLRGKRYVAWQPVRHRG